MPEMQEPEKISPKIPGNYLEIMSKVVFQSGMSYKIVESKWPAPARRSTTSTPPRWPA
jgi:hypothetical protein